MQLKYAWRFYVKVGVPYHNNNQLWVFSDCQMINGGFHMKTRSRIRANVKAWRPYENWWWTDSTKYHDDVIEWKHFLRYWPFLWVTGWFPSQRPVTRSVDVFFWSAPEQTVEQTIETPFFLDTIPPIMTSLQCVGPISGGHNRCQVNIGPTHLGNMNSPLWIPEICFQNLQ